MNDERLLFTRDFELVALDFEVQPYLDQLAANSELWDSGRDFRHIPRYGGELSPHRESQDIWVRHQNYEHLPAYDEPGGMEGMLKPEVSEWYAESKKLPAAFDMADAVCRVTRAIQLGGHYIIKVPAGKQVYPHRDFSWHSTYYDKYMVILQTAPEGVSFGWERSGILIPEAGDLWRFENDTVHWVLNSSEEDVLIATFSVRTFDRDRREILA
jgi:hypothetical protein